MGVPFWSPRRFLQFVTDHPMHARLRRLVPLSVGVATLLPLALGACAQDAGPACPDVAILRDADRITQFTTAGGRDLTDIAYEGEITAIKGSCGYDGEQTRATVEMTVTFAWARGPAGRGDNAEFTYFIAILDGDRKVVARQEFPTQVTFKDGANRAAGNEELEQEIPLPKGVPGASYRVLVGFKLTPEQLARNRDGGAPRLVR